MTVAEVKEVYLNKPVEHTHARQELIPNVCGQVTYFHQPEGRTVIHNLAVEESHQRLGWGRLLFYRVLCSAIEHGSREIAVFYPEDSEAGEFLERLGFNSIGRQWVYDIKLPLLFYCADGGRNRYSAIASTVGWRLGLRSDETKTPLHCQMVDNCWTGYYHARHLAAVQHHKPLIATARDIEHPDQLPEILAQATELAQYAGRVILIPKCVVPIDKSYWLGLPCGQYAGTSDPAWYRDRYTHLLGGSPNTQAYYAKHLNVVSLDGNYSMNLARYGTATWQGVQQKKTGGCYEAFQLSLEKQKAYWHREWDFRQEPMGAFLQEGYQSDSRRS